jgi:hypothetical protein
MYGKRITIQMNELHTLQLKYYVETYGVTVLIFVIPFVTVVTILSPPDKIASQTHFVLLQLHW